MAVCPEVSPRCIRAFKHRTPIELIASNQSHGRLGRRKIQFNYSISVKLSWRYSQSVGTAKLGQNSECVFSILSDERAIPISPAACQRSTRMGSGAVASRSVNPSIEIVYSLA